MDDSDLNQELSMPFIFLLLLGLGVFLWFQYAGESEIIPKISSEMEDFISISNCERTHNGTALSCVVTAKKNIPARFFASVYYDKSNVKLGQISFPSYPLNSGDRAKEAFASSVDFGKIRKVEVFYIR